MEKIDLHERFIQVLEELFPRKTELALSVADLLKIEKESVYRRLRGNVQFSVREMGTIAQHFGISLDELLQKDSVGNLTRLKMEAPRTVDSMERIIEELDRYIDSLIAIGNQPYIEAGSIINALPPEFYIPFPLLTKFLYFKWRYYYVDSDVLKDYAKWELPEALSKYYENIMTAFESFDKVFYILDNSTVWNLVNDINYFIGVHIISREDADALKKEIHRVLDYLEHLAQTGVSGNKRTKIDIYVSNVNIGASYCYLWSEKLKVSYFTTFFMQSSVSENSATCLDTCRWINAMKRISTLITKSGE
ncbi:MAG: hypothetical protein LBT78_07610, partial [Tannerella sp.]|nr:hypothetical protein [Tannerella sp.]